MYKKTDEKHILRSHVSVTAAKLLRVPVFGHPELPANKTENQTEQKKFKMMSNKSCNRKRESSWHDHERTRFAYAIRCELHTAHGKKRRITQRHNVHFMWSRNAHTLHTPQTTRSHTVEYETHISKSTGHYSHRIHEHIHITHARTRTNSHTDTQYSLYKSTFNGRDNTNTCSSYRTLLFATQIYSRNAYIKASPVTRTPGTAPSRSGGRSECEFSNFATRATRTDVKSGYDACAPVRMYERFLSPPHTTEYCEDHAVGYSINKLPISNNLT